MLRGQQRLRDTSIAWNMGGLRVKQAAVRAFAAAPSSSSSSSSSSNCHASLAGVFDFAWHRHQGQGIGGHGSLCIGHKLVSDMLR